jgi:hypothetical protein
VSLGTDTRISFDLSSTSSSSRKHTFVRTSFSSLIAHLVTSNYTIKSHFCQGLLDAIWNKYWAFLIIWLFLSGIMRQSKSWRGERGWRCLRGFRNALFPSPSASLASPAFQAFPPSSFPKKTTPPQQRDRVRKWAEIGRVTGWGTRRRAWRPGSTPSSRRP